MSGKEINMEVKGRKGHHLRQSHKQKSINDVFQVIIDQSIMLGRQILPEVEHSSPVRTRQSQPGE
jgi:hypothetical protein